MPDYVLEHPAPGDTLAEGDEARRAIITTTDPLSEDDLEKARRAFIRGKTVAQIEKVLNLGLSEAETRTPDQVEYVTVPRVEYEALLALQTKGEE